MSDVSYDLWRFLHILMFVFWLGTDMGVLLATKRSTDRSLSPETRMNLLMLALVIELLPRAMWKLAFPLGLQLSSQAGLIDVGATTLIVVWILSGVWLVVSVGGAANVGKPVGERLTRLNRVIIPVVGVATLGLGVYSYVTGGPFETGWLSLKVALYGVINLAVVGIEASFAPAVPAYVKLVQSGATPEIDDRISRIVGRTIVWVSVTYLLIAAVAFIGTVKPV